MKKTKNPLENNTDKRRTEMNSNNSTKVVNPDNNKVFSSTMAQKKTLNLGLKMNKNQKGEIHYEGPHTNRYDFPESHQEYFFNNNDAKFNAPKNFINYENNDVNERNKSSNKLSNHTNSFKNNYETTNEKYIQNNHNIMNSNISGNTIQNTTKLESYTKKFGQILHKGEKKY